MDSLSIAIQLTFKDFLNFQFGHLKKRMMPFLVFFILMLAISFLGVFTSDNSFIDWISPIAGCLGFPLIFIGLIYFNSKRTFNTDSFLRKEHTYNFSKERLRITSENSDLIIEWNDIYKFTTTKQYLLIYLSPQKAFILPKHFFKDDEQAFILSLLKSEIKPKKNYSLFFNLGLYIFLIIMLLYVFGVFSPTSTNYLNKAYEAENKGNYKEAIECFNKAIEENPKLVEAYLHRGYSKSQLGDIKGYLEDCNKAIEANDNYAEAYKIRAILKQEFNDSTGACEDFKKAISLGDKKSIDLSKGYCN